MDAIQVSKLLDLPLYGGNIEITEPSSLSRIKINSVVFANNYSEETIQVLNKNTEILAIVLPQYTGKLNCTYIVTTNPRLEFARILQEFFVKKVVPKISKTSVIGNNVLLGRDVVVGEYVVISDNVSIGDNTELRNHVVIAENTIIGSNCLIKSHTVIGEEGFGFEFNSQGQPIRIPHIGTVEIGNNVEIGAFNSIARATLDKTIIKEYVKTDDHVHIAHNVIIEENSIVTACAEISGSVFIGKNSWISPNVSINNNIKVGHNSMIGIGSVVTKDVLPNYIVVGNPARAIKER